MSFQLHVEALIFSAQKAISFKEIHQCLENLWEKSIEAEDILSALAAIGEKYASEDFSFELMELSGGYQFLTKSMFHKTISIFLQQKSKKRLSRAAMETLSVIAYKQPITKVEVEQVRGVNCDYSIQKLLEKELIAIQGRSDLPGRPLIYKTSDNFMDYFGLKSVDDLPQLKDVESEVESEIGERNE
ncbi:MAG: SMC-Scp complex subunit ScpB [Chitinophagales bacterium]